MAEFTAVTNASGVADFGYIPVGTYTLAQTIPVDGYTAIISEQVTINSITHTIDKTNSPTNPKTLTITKVDQDGAALAGATFTLYDATGLIVLDTKSTTASVNVLEFANLASTVTGKAYQYNESVVPTHYTANEDLVPISVTDDIDETVVNTLAEGEVTLSLADANYSALKLANSTFTLTN